MTGGQAQRAVREADEGRAAERRDIQSYYGESDRELARRYLARSFPELDRAYFEAAAAHRYALYPEMPGIVRFEDFRDSDVLEIGVGQGTDHRMFAEAGARVIGIDLTAKHCAITRQCLDAFGYRARLAQADMCDLPFRDGAFDHVYACGVLFLTRRIGAAIAEIGRVLRPGGTVTAMFYNRSSVHYWIKTRLYYGWALDEDRVIGRRALESWYTDGPGYVDVDYYRPRAVRRLFGAFDRVRWRTTCLTAEQLPDMDSTPDRRTLRWLESRYGFFLWVEATR